MTGPLATLTRINLDDLLSAFGWRESRVLGWVARQFFRAPASDFARQMIRFDMLIADRGLAQAACLTERLYARSVLVYGRGHVPDGPVLFMANHPGVTDTLALLASLDRDDLTIIALDRPFLVVLPSLSHHLAFVTDQPSARAALVRKIGLILRRGGAVLTFPAGRNELDPDISANAVDSLVGWINSADVLARLAPQAAIVPVCVRGVFWSRVARLPLLRLRRSADDQQLLGSALQLLWSVALRRQPVGIRVQFGKPVHVRASRTGKQADAHRAVLAEMRRLIENPPEGEAEQVL